VRAVIRDAATLRGIGLHDLVAYLRAKGWTEQASPYERASVWVKPDAPAEPAELLLPKSDGVADYIARMADVVAALEELEGRSQIEIAHDLMLASVDIVRLRHPAANDSADSIPIADGVSLIENARNLLFSVATTAVLPRSVLPPRRPPEAIEYMRNVHLGHTERGSYVVTLISRVAPLLTPGKPGLLEIMEEPFPRVVTRTLSRALIATKNAVAEAASTGRFEAFERSVESGVSANLCDAIVGMARSEQGTHAISIHLHWAPSRPVPDAPPEPVLFREDAIPIIEEAARVFREEGPYEDAFVTGVVTRLHREPDAVAGTVAVACVLEGKSRHLIATLDEASYHVAVQAHDRMDGVTFRADVARDGRAFRANNVRELRIIEE
jgi:hypothetical protein